MIGEEIRVALAKKRWSIAKAAKESGVERTFLSRLINGFPPPRVKEGRQTAEIDPRYRQLAETLSIPDPDAFIQEVMDAQANSSSPVLSAQQKRFLRHLAGHIKVDPRYKADIWALLNSCVTAAGSPYRYQRLRRLFFKNFEPQPPNLVDSSLSKSSSYIGPDHSERPEAGDLSRLLDTVGDQISTVQEDYAIDTQFEIAQLFFELSRQVLTEPQALHKAVELARQVNEN